MNSYIWKRVSISNLGKSQNLMKQYPRKNNHLNVLTPVDGRSDFRGYIIKLDFELMKVLCV